MSKVSKTSVAARSWWPRATILATGLAAAALLTTACGQKGPLTLPEPAPVPAAPAAAASAPR